MHVKHILIIPSLPGKGVKLFVAKAINEKLEMSKIALYTLAPS